jgi:hypothetical protein
MDIGKFKNLELMNGRKIGRLSGKYREENSREDWIKEGRFERVGLE